MERVGRVILHIDMDAFYASVEQADNPALKGKPVIVGGTSNRGVVSAASYEAREYGIHSAMPIFQAKKKCPQGVFLPVRMARYKLVSRKVMHVLGGFSPLVEQISIDEAYMDGTGGDRLFGTPEALGQEVKGRIGETTSLSCSIGIAPNKFLAKVASDMDKPDGLTIITPDQAPEFIARLPIEKVPGVGQKMARRLRRLNVAFLGDITRIPESLLTRESGKFGIRLLALAMDLDGPPVVPFNEAKSISSEQTLRADTSDRKILKKHLLIESERVGKRLRAKALKGSTVTLKLKRADFTLMTRSVTLEKPTGSTEKIYRKGLELLEDFAPNVKVRLIGIGVSKLVTRDRSPGQLDLFEWGKYPEGAWEDVERAMDRIKERFGGGAITRGSTLPEDPESH
ncbi:MAG: DNA polymerase IV [Deltaproteobacteria bacterium]|nr:DNA polymerase IV [Deltaproteobacteria bacterium]